MYICHLVAHARGNATPLWHDPTAAMVWSRLRRAFPDAHCILMPDHIHLMVIVRCIVEAQRRFRTVLGTVSRSLGGAPLWQPIPPPEVLSTPDKALRLTRYLPLNPCRPWLHRGKRVRLVDDPLRWRWSTYRDLLGAIAEPWIESSRWAELIGVPRVSSTEWLHGYVSSDPHVARDGTPMPLVAPAAALPVRTFEDLVRAVESCTRLPRGMAAERGLFRTLLVGLAHNQGYRSTRDLAALCQVDPRSIRRLATRCPPAALSAARLCLGDERLLEVVAPGTSILRTSNALPPPVAQSLSAEWTFQGLPGSHPAANALRSHT